MKTKYTKKQITEAIAYWKKQLKKMNESNLVKPSFDYTAKPITLQQLIDTMSPHETNYELKSFRLSLAYDDRAICPVTTLAKVSDDEYVLFSLEFDRDVANDYYNNADYMRKLKAERTYPEEFKAYPNIVLGKMTEYDRIMHSVKGLMTSHDNLTLGDICKYVKPTDKIYMGLEDSVFSGDGTIFAATIDLDHSSVTTKRQILLWPDVDSQTGELWN